MQTEGKRQKYRRYLDVRVTFRSDGQMMPQEILWDQTHRYSIARVLEVVPRPAYGAGGQGDCYTVQIELGEMVHERRLFFERSAALSGREIGRWFVEADLERR
ncbi:MAG: hypothetical protein HDQ87_08580 [Clostridia bacterium]|nr:hypothetical protein [Clostridia bacterium]